MFINISYKGEFHKVDYTVVKTRINVIMLRFQRVVYEYYY